MAKLILKRGQLKIRHVDGMIISGVEIPPCDQTLIIPESADTSFMSLMPHRSTSFEAFTPQIAFKTNSQTSGPEMYLTEGSYQQLVDIVTEKHINEVEVGIIVARHHRSRNKKGGVLYREIARQPGVPSKTKKKLIKGASIIWKHCQLNVSPHANESLPTRSTDLYLASTSSTLHDGTGYKIIGSEFLLRYVHPLKKSAKDAPRSRKAQLDTDHQHKFYFFGLIFRVSNAAHDGYIFTSFSRKSIRLWSKYNENDDFIGIDWAEHNGYFGRRTIENKLPIIL